jgi:hypothetical protein
LFGYRQMSQITQLLETLKAELADIEREYLHRREKLTFAIEKLEAARADGVPPRRHRKAMPKPVLSPTRSQSMGASGLDAPIPTAQAPIKIEGPPPPISDFAAFLIEILADGQGRDEKELAQEAERRGWNFADKNPVSSVHGGLLNAAKRKFVETRDGRWFKCSLNGIGEQMLTG